MIHQFRDKKQMARKRKIIIYIIIFCVFIFSAIFGFFKISSDIFEYIGRPIWHTEKVITEKLNGVDYLTRTKKSVWDENEKLLAENENLRISMFDYQTLKSENTQLKELLGRLPKEHNLILADILTKPNHSPYDTIIIDAGNKLEVKEGQKIYANGIVPIGIISKVYEYTSLVTLYSNPGQKTEAIIEGSNASVELIGRGGGNFEMTIPIDLLSEKGTKILLPNIEPEILAYINEIISSPTDPMKKVLLSSPVNIQNLKWVEIKK